MKRKNISQIQVPEKLRERIKKIASREGVLMPDLVELLMENPLSSLEKGTKTIKKEVKELK